MSGRTAHTRETTPTPQAAARMEQPEPVAAAKVGRPPADEAQSEVFHVRVTTDVYDAYCRHALRVGVSLSAIVREVIVRHAPRG